MPHIEFFITKFELYQHILNYDVHDENDDVILTVPNRRDIFFPDRKSCLNLLRKLVPTPFDFSKLNPQSLRTFCNTMQRLHLCIKNNKMNHSIFQKFIDNLKNSTVKVVLAYKGKNVLSHNVNCKKKKALKDLRKKYEIRLNEIRKLKQNLAEYKYKFLKCTKFPDKVKYICPRNMKKHLTDYSKRQKLRLAKERADLTLGSLEFLKVYGIEPLCLKVKNANDEVEYIQLSPDNDFEEKQKTPLESWLFVKDFFNISDDAFNDIAKLTKDAPRLHNIKQKIHDLNGSFNLKATPGGQGVQFDLKSRVAEQVQRLINDKDFNEEKVRIKFSGDGFLIGRKVHLVNFSFTLPQESNCQSPSGNYGIAIFAGDDKYPNLEVELKNISKDIEFLEENGTQVAGKHVELDIFHGGDLKYLAACFGIQAANGEYPCVWCKCPKDKFWNYSLDWSVVDITKGARTNSEIDDLASKPKKKKKKRGKEKDEDKKFGCKAAPLFSTNPDKVVPDLLHMQLRITDQLFGHLVKDLERLDKIAGENSQLDKLEKSLKEIGLSFKIYEDKDTKKLQYRDFSGPEQLILLKKYDVKAHFPNLDNVDKISDLWSDFLNILMFLKSCKSRKHSNFVKDQTKNWMTKFCQIYQKCSVTPYMHIFHAHIHEFIDLYGNIFTFSQQGLEALNRVYGKNFFQSTNHRGTEALGQLLMKQKRLETVNESKPKKRKYCCSLCKEENHSKRRCPKKE